MKEYPHLTTAAERTLLALRENFAEINNRRSGIELPKKQALKSQQSSYSLRQQLCASTGTRNCKKQCDS